jgi:hypothetical protein
MPTTTTSTTGGIVMQDAVGLGVRSSLGPATVAGELAPGFRVAMWSAEQLPDQVRAPAQAWFVLRARAAASLWLTTNVTLGFVAETDTVRTGDYAVGVSLGIHMFPYDGMR